MQNRFSIGEMSRLMNVPIKTLRYYDEIGLFKPSEVNAQNGYRYYSTEQFEQLDIIKYLRFLGVPLSQIRTHFTHRRVDYFLQLLKKQEESIDSRIRDLEAIRRKFDRRTRELEEALNVVETDIVEIRRFPLRQVLRLQENVQSGPSLEMSVRKLGSLFGAAPSPIFVGKVGLTVSEENLRLGNFLEYNSVFISLDESIDNAQFATHLPEGEYACMFFRGLHGDSPAHYQKLLQYIEQNGYAIAGESVERTIVDEYVSKDPRKFLTEIQIPIVPRLESDCCAGV